MRISTQQLYRNGIANLGNAQQELTKTQEQISAGKKILSPADDPVGASRVLRLNQELEQNSQFQKNVDLAQSRLELEDGVLESVTEVYQRVRELAIQSGDGILSAADRNSIAQELRSRLDQLKGLANSTDGRGEYLFGGFQNTQAPFQQTPSGSVEYTSDEGRRFIQISSSVTIAGTDNGNSVFMDVKSAGTTICTDSSKSNTSSPPAHITIGQVTDQAKLNAFAPEDMKIVFNDVNTVAPPGPNFSVFTVSDNRPIVTAQPYTPGATINIEASGVQVEVQGAPAVGDAFFVRTSDKQPVFDTLERFIDGLEQVNDTPEGRATFSAMLDTTIANLDNAETAMLEVRTEVGARLNTVEDTRAVLEDNEIILKELRSKVEDLDYAKAISDLSFQSFVLQAAQQTFSRVTGLSLFDQL
ncbi:flagellar hook-associated protein FlgL [Allohahella sp. A8]|uniref:flagellar hook-associated protein FlgL n=1 Tax=Allohahella sp. A8 TaxID=3141461 RepID=UPI000C0ABEFC|nr:flagellar hook-associated protein 3 [Hahellaceae bacterium]|tara:strand:- start:58506 stop:59750 length:1245 start_codon:yes stop_codon:yes gene_type:complete